MTYNRLGLLIVWMFGLVLVSACGGEPPVEGEEVLPTMTPITIDEKQITPKPACTPPPCGADEAYHCPDECIGGCGTVCATHTPLPELGTTETSEPGTLLPDSVRTFPDPSKYAWSLIATDLNKPLGFTHAGDHSGRSFILEQPGVIWVYQNGERLSTPFLDIRDRVEDSQNEQGLLGLAFHPDFKGNGFFYVNYTGKGGDTRISRFQISGDGNIADPGSEKLLLQIKQPYANHNGGHLLFGPDGYLYIGTGDGGSGGDPQGNAQNTNSLLGKLLRIDVDHGDPYAVPGDNPYIGGGGRPEIWAIGLRNPWRYTFDRATGNFYIGDVGQNAWEEISFLEAGHPGGANFGWNFLEASHAYGGSPPEDVIMIPPIWEYNHAQGCSVTGGISYRGSMPEWQGIYVYGDFCSGTVWGLLQNAEGVWQNMILYQTVVNITSFGEDEFGELYMVGRNGSVYMLEPNP
jgi:glucose/arabinose dehydrogenase